MMQYVLASELAIALPMAACGTRAAIGEPPHATMAETLVTAPADAPDTGVSAPIMGGIALPSQSEPAAARR